MTTEDTVQFLAKFPRVDGNRTGEIYHIKLHVQPFDILNEVKQATHHAILCSQLPIYYITLHCKPSAAMRYKSYNTI